MALVWSIFPDGNDKIGSIGNKGDDWNPGIWDAASGTIIKQQAGSGVGAVSAGLAYTGTPAKYYCGRAVLIFTTSYLPPLMNITGGQVFLPGFFDSVVTFVDGTGVHEPVIGTDYALLRAATVSLGSGSPGPGASYDAVPLNALGLAQINLAGKTYYGLRSLPTDGPGAPGLGTSINADIGAPTIDSFDNIVVAAPVVTPDSAQVTGKFTTGVSGGTNRPPILQVSGPGSGNYSNLDVRFRIDDPFHVPFAYTPWRMNWGLEDVLTETVGGLFPGTGYDAWLEYRFHGTSTAYATVEAAFGTPALTNKGGGGIPSRLVALKAI